MMPERQIGRFRRRLDGTEIGPFELIGAPECESKIR
jgi:hypothetical protein